MSVQGDLIEKPAHTVGRDITEWALTSYPFDFTIGERPRLRISGSGREVVVHRVTFRERDLVPPCDDHPKARGDTQIEIVAPANLNCALSGILRVRQVVSAMSFLPWEQRSFIKEIILMHEDVEGSWFMTARPNGTIRIYPSMRTPYHYGSPRPGITSRRETFYGLLHEIGHLWSFKHWGYEQSPMQTTGGDVSEGWRAYQAAIIADDRSISGYADKNIHEDIAETYAAWHCLINDSSYHIIRELMPQRFAILEAKHWGMSVENLKRVRCLINQESVPSQELSLQE